MQKNELFDVLVVYSPAIATSASVKDSNVKFPFSEASGRTNYNDAYEYFLKSCANFKLKAAFTTSNDITSQGDRFKNYWIIKSGKWTKVDKICYSSIIFDKFSPVSTTQASIREILFSNIDIKSFNNPEVYLTFFDKFRTYELLGKFTIPTVEVSARTKKAVTKALTELKLILKNHPNSTDFSDKIVIKDRFGAGGRNVFTSDKAGQFETVLNIVKKYKGTSFIIQPFVKFNKGFAYRVKDSTSSAYKNLEGNIDIRVIYLKSKVVQVYLRVAKKDDFRCNEHQGGTLEYIPTKDLPKEVRKLSKQIISQIDQESSLFALDFVISDNGNIYLMEGNCGPGLDWNLSLKKNELKAKYLIRMIVKDIAKRVKFNKLVKQGFNLVQPEKPHVGKLPVHI